MGKILLIDKPSGMTSFDVCFKLRHIFNTKKIGHTGTLDPNATGLMMILVGNAVKANQFLVTATKEYIATVKIGISTSTLDIDGEVLEKKEEVMPPKEEIVKIVETFKGKSLQTPPLTSAIKINGRRLYEYQRQGMEVEIKAREIEIYQIEVLEVTSNTFTFKTKVSSGTYIRTLAQDILAKLGIIGTLSALRRTAIDDFNVVDSNKLDDVLNNEYKELSETYVLSKYYQTYVVDRKEDVLNGKPLKIDSEEKRLLIVDKNNEALAIYQKEGLVYRTVRGLL